MALPNISDIVALVKPSVVAITASAVLDFNRQYTEGQVRGGLSIPASS
jgi:hypothetical protein